MALRVADELRLIGVRTSVIRAVVHHVQNEVKRIDTAEEVQRHAGAWIGVTCRRAKIVRVLLASDPSKAKRGELDGVTEWVDVIGLARGLGERRNPNSRSLVSGRKR